MAHQLHIASQRPQRGLVIAIPRAAQTDNQPHAVQRVLLLPLHAANIADAMVAADCAREAPKHKNQEPNKSQMPMIE
jgi:hypothetical protein